MAETKEKKPRKTRKDKGTKRGKRKGIKNPRLQTGSIDFRTIGTQQTIGQPNLTSLVGTMASLARQNQPIQLVANQPTTYTPTPPELSLVKRKPRDVIAKKTNPQYDYIKDIMEEKYGQVSEDNQVVGEVRRAMGQRIQNERRRAEEELSQVRQQADEEILQVRQEVEKAQDYAEGIFNDLQVKEQDYDRLQKRAAKDYLTGLGDLAKQQVAYTHNMNEMKKDEARQFLRNKTELIRSQMENAKAINELQQYTQSQQEYLRLSLATQQQQHSQILQEKEAELAEFLRLDEIQKRVLKEEREREKYLQQASDIVDVNKLGKTALVKLIQEKNPTYKPEGDLTDIRSAYLQEVKGMSVTKEYTFKTREGARGKASKEFDLIPTQELLDLAKIQQLESLDDNRAELQRAQSEVPFEEVESNFQDTPTRTVAGVELLQSGRSFSASPRARLMAAKEYEESQPQEPEPIAEQPKPKRKVSELTSGELDLIIREARKNPTDERLQKKAQIARKELDRRERNFGND